MNFIIKPIAPKKGEKRVPSLPRLGALGTKWTEGWPTPEEQRVESARKPFSYPGAGICYTPTAKDLTNPESPAPTYRPKFVDTFHYESYKSKSPTPSPRGSPRPAKPESPALPPPARKSGDRDRAGVPEPMSPSLSRWDGDDDDALLLYEAAQPDIQLMPRDLAPKQGSNPDRSQAGTRPVGKPGPRAPSPLSAKSRPYPVPPPGSLLVDRRTNAQAQEAPKPEPMDTGTEPGDPDRSATPLAAASRSSTPLTPKSPRRPGTSGPLSGQQQLDGVEQVQPLGTGVQYRGIRYDGRLSSSFKEGDNTRVPPLTLPSTPHARPRSDQQASEAGDGGREADGESWAPRAGNMLSDSPRVHVQMLQLPSFPKPKARINKSTHYSHPFAGSPSRMQCRVKMSRDDRTLQLQTPLGSAPDTQFLIPPKLYVHDGEKPGLHVHSMKVLDHARSNPFSRSSPRPGPFHSQPQLTRSVSVEPPSSAGGLHSDRHITGHPEHLPMSQAPATDRPQSVEATNPPSESSPRFDPESARIEAVLKEEIYARAAQYRQQQIKLKSSATGRDPYARGDPYQRSSKRAPVKSLFTLVSSPPPKGSPTKTQELSVWETDSDKPAFEERLFMTSPMIKFDFSDPNEDFLREKVPKRDIEEEIASLVAEVKAVRWIDDD